MTTANPQLQKFQLFRKLSTEVRPPASLRRDERIPMTCSFEELVESEEEDIQLPERTSPNGRSPFAVVLQSPFAERRAVSPQNLSPTYARKLASPRLCRGFSDPRLHSRQQPTFMLGSLGPDRHDAGSDLLTLPTIHERASSSPDYEDDCEEVQ